MNKPSSFSYENRPPEDPTDRLRDELSRRGWTQQTFAHIIGRPPQLVSEIINGKKEITRETALEFGAALDTPADVWLHLQTDYLLWEMRRREWRIARLAVIRERAQQA